jgi:hypothetical protein
MEAMLEEIWAVNNSSCVMLKAMEYILLGELSKRAQTTVL